MKKTILAVTARSITLELDNETPYYAPEAMDIYINELLVLKGWTKNVISLYALMPETTYDIKVVGLESGFILTHVQETRKESVRLDVGRFGALGDGTHLDSTAIQAAIAACPIDGTVYLPKGVYLCTPIFIKSDMTIELAKGAVILGHTDRHLYPILPGYTMTTDETDEYYLGTWEGNPLDAYASLITGIGVQNSAIIGEGTIDGNAQNSDWWVKPKVKRTAWRPRTIFMKGCDHCLLQGVTVQNSPSWTIHPYLSTNLTFLDLKVNNHKDSPNTDGLDPESCSDVRIIGVDFSVGDDCIAIKSGKLYMGQKLKRPSERFIISNCRMRHGHGAVVIGSEMSGGVVDIKVTNCLFEETDRGLRIKTRRGRGKDGIIDNISFEHIHMFGVLTPFVINMYYFCDPDGKSEVVWSRKTETVDAGTPFLGSFRFKHIHCKGCQVAAGAFYGLPEQPIEEVLLEDVHIEFADQCVSGQPAMMSFAEDVSKQGFMAEHVKQLTLKNVNIDGLIGPRVTRDQATQVMDNRKETN